MTSVTGVASPGASGVRDALGQVQTAVQESFAAASSLLCHLSQLAALIPSWGPEHIQKGPAKRSTFSFDLDQWTALCSGKALPLPGDLSFS